MTDDVTYPEGIGSLLHAMLAPPPQAGPPYVHTFQQPEPVPLLDDDGQPVLDDAGEPVTQVPLLPTHTITHTWELPQDWQDAIANPAPDSELDPAILAATVFFQEHAFIYGLDRATELQPEVEAAIARVHVDPAGRVARILDGADWTDARLGEGRWSR